MGFAARIAELRRTRGESLQDVAKAVGVTKTHIWELERGRAANPSFNVIKGLADHFEVSVAYLIDEDIKAPDADQELGRMFRLAGDLEPNERKIVADLIQSFRRQRKERAGSRS